MAGMDAGNINVQVVVSNKAFLDTVGNVIVEVFGAEVVLDDASDLRILLRRELMLNVDLHDLED